jgi:uncharacterized protein
MYAPAGVGLSLLLVTAGLMLAGCSRGESLEVRNLREAAARGEPEAQNALGNLYNRGVGVVEDQTEAANLYRQAAERGYADAESNLGRMYGTGRGVPQDSAKAAYWFRVAAQQGSASGENRLGEAYRDGKGVPQDFSEAVGWFRKAAEKGDADAQFHLGECYRDGEGVEHDLIEAHRWMNVAAARTRDDPSSAMLFARARDELTKRMTVEQVSEAQKRAREWFGRYEGSSASAAQVR